MEPPLLYPISFTSMPHPTLLIFFFLLLVPYQAKSRSISKINDGLPLLEEENEAIAREEGEEVW